MNNHGRFFLRIAKDTGLVNRNRKILFAVVAEYIATGQPVGSRTLSRKYVSDLSPATIRNVLADLEEGGFLLQPHASAGRVPSERALRAFIDALTDFEDIPAAQQRDMVRRFEQIFTETERAKTDTLRETGAFLSELSGAAAVVTTSPIDTRQLGQLRFIVTKPQQLLAVLVFLDGTVENRFIDIDQPLTERDLLRIHSLLGDVVEGRTLASLRELLSRRADDERVRVDQLRSRAFELGSKAVQDVSGASEMVIEGGQRLVAMPEYGDVERLRQLLRALEDRHHLLQLLDKTMLAGGAATVFIGSESGQSSELGAAQLSLVCAPYGTERGKGTVGVLGPTRMDYAKMVPLVDAAAAALTAAIKNTK